jgi:regulator of replication initiation timing
MNKQEIDKASSQLSQAIRYFAPMIDALNHASDVFDALSNAIPHQNALNQNIDELKTQIDSLITDLEDKKSLVLQQDVLVTQAKEEASKKIADVTSDADTQVKDILASIATRTQLASNNFSVKQQEIADTLSAAQKNSSSAIAALQAQEQSLKDSIAVLETKLDALKKQAQKFAAVFTAE